VWQPENYTLQWVLGNRSGFWQVTAVGEKRRTASSGFGNATLNSWDFGSINLQYWNEADPLNATTWYTWTRTACAITGSPVVILFSLQGNFSGSPDKEANFEPNSVTAWPVVDRSPSVTFGSGTGASAYALNAILKNTTTGSGISVSYPLAFGQSLEVDTENKKVTSLQDSTSPLGALRLLNARPSWFSLSSGSNTIQFYEDSVLGVQVRLEWKDRQA
jgi:hypothetical protein